jgi:hypothetical protein
VILAEDLERLVVRRASLMNEIVNTLLARYQIRSLPNRRILSSGRITNIPFRNVKRLIRIIRDSPRSASRAMYGN